MAKKQFSIQVEEELLATIDAAAESRGVSRNAVVVDMLAGGLIGARIEDSMILVKTDHGACYIYCRSGEGHPNWQWFQGATIEELQQFFKEHGSHKT